MLLKYRLPLDVNANQAAEDPPIKVLVEIEKVLDALASNDDLSQCNGVSAPISLTGRVINATIWEEELWQLIQRDKIVEVGSFVRLRNINNSKLPSGVECEYFSARKTPFLKQTKY